MNVRGGILSGMPTDNSKLEVSTSKGLAQRAPYLSDFGAAFINACVEGIYHDD
jgi:hypothetical protein